ncbi:MAG TPA: hypothetical protein VF121_01340 [Thermoanaerobaculia bacterium]|nr:hypothetical protein [Thermoanaerobaculia bacterium]
MSQEIEAKLDVLAGMNAALGKLTNVQIRLTLAGEEALAGQMDTQRKALLKQIETLQGQVADQWTVEAAVLAEDLRQANGKLQDRIRNIKNKVDVANNAIQIVGQIDDALAFLKTVVAA